MSFSFNEFTEEVVADLYAEKHGMKDILLPLCNKKKAYLYYLDQKKHFWLRINHGAELFKAQEMYMSYYQSVKSTILTKPADIQSGQIEGIVCIHPSAEIHPDAKIGPNVTIGAEVKVGEGARIVNSIILEDVVLHPHSVVMHSIIGWTSVIGSWARVEGIPNKENQHTYLILSKQNS